MEIVVIFMLLIYITAKKLHDRDFEILILCDKSIPLNDQVEKLMSKFYDNKNYTLSLYMLNYCFKKRIKTKRIHYVIYAEQSNSMKPHFFLCNEKSTECSINKDKIGVELFKPMTNSNSGKQIENVRKYKDTRIANNENNAKKITTNATFNDCHILSENVTLYDIRKPNVLLDKPIIVGFTILEIEQLEMNIHFDRLKDCFGDNMRLLYRRTYSLKFLIKNTNPYQLDNRLKDLLILLIFLLILFFL